MPILQFFLDDRSPFTLEFRVDTGATLPRVEVQVMDGNDPVALTSPVVTFTLIDKDGNVKISAAAGVVVDAAKGIVGYDLKAADVDVEDEYFGQFEITVSGGGVFKIPNDADQRLSILIGKVDVFS